MDTTLIAPGLHGSGRDHWQTWLERKVPGSVRVEQQDWTAPELARWTDSLLRHAARVQGRSVVVAHSFGCLAAVQAAFEQQERFGALMLVAPADPERFGLADALAEGLLGVPAVLVASTNDRWMSIERARRWSDTWGCELVSLGSAGHINAESGFGPWPRGLEIYHALRTSLPRAHARHLEEGTRMQRN